MQPFFRGLVCQPSHGRGPRVMLNYSWRTRRADLTSRSTPDRPGEATCVPRSGSHGQSPNRRRDARSRTLGRPRRKRPPRGGLLVLSEPPEEDSPWPEEWPLLPLRSDVVFPQTVVPLVVNRTGGIRLIDDVLGGDKLLGLVTQRHPGDRRAGDGRPLSDGLRRLGPEDAQVPRRLDPDRLPGDVPRRLDRDRPDRALPGRPGRAAARTSSRKGSSSTRWCITSTGSSRGWSTRASKCPRSCRSPR